MGDILSVTIRGLQELESSDRSRSKDSGGPEENHQCLERQLLHGRSLQFL